MTQSWRLPEGGAIDRSRPLAFDYDGNRYEGYAGDTLASALLANGVHLVARSFKYHRPRGIYSAGAEEPNALESFYREARACACFLAAPFRLLPSSTTFSGWLTSPTSLM